MSVVERRWTANWGMVPLRLAVSIVFLMHGGQKAFVFGIADVSDMLLKLGFFWPTFFAYVLIFAELAGGMAILVGLFTTLAGVGLAIEMAIAIWVARLGGGFFTPYGYEFEMTLLAASLTIAAVGPGPISLAHYLRNRTSPQS